MPAPISDARRRRLLQLVYDDGYSVRKAAAIAGVSYSWARTACQGYQNAADRDKDHAQLVDQAMILQRPLRKDELGARALKALDDFGFFRATYLGRVSSPWHEDAAHQIVDRYESPHKEFVVINVAPGGGKALALDTPLPTPTGWTTMKDVQPGDRLLDAQGKPCSVTYKSEVFYGHDCYEVRSDDGASVIADANHLWPVRLGGEGQYHYTGRPNAPGKTGPKTRGVNGIRTQTTAYLAKPRHKRPQLAVARPLDLRATDLPVDPYVLGAWLGDGDSRSARVYSHPADAEWLHNRFTSAGIVVTASEHNNLIHLGLLGVGKGLRALEVLGNKHIPPAYLRASYAQRLALLQGLIDTDGYVDHRGRVEFTSISRRLAQDAQHLARTLGVKASMHEGRAKIDGRDCGPKYRVSFMRAQAASLPRKAEKCRDGIRTPHRYLTVTKVESVPTQCIQVDSPDHLFLAGDGLLVTHNTTMMHDVAAWMTVKNRRMRGVFGSRTYPNAARQTRRLRRTLERTKPPMAKSEELADGMAIDATAAIALDFGLFRPPVRTDLWRGEEFVVMQDDDIPIDEKEPTWSTVGMDTGFLGNRYDAIFWDDVVDSSTIKTMEAIEKQRQWWDDEAESRLEPRGAMFLVGQRFAANDLYRYCLDKRVPLEEEDLDAYSEDELAGMELEQPGMYTHIMYKAHYEDRCVKEHSRDAAPWPTGCLLDPKRVAWRDIRAKNPRTFAIQYQQEDANPEDVLVKPIYVKGGTDPDTGITHRGCWDEDRSIGELPEGLIPPIISYATCDPSPTKWWAIQWWAFTPNAANQLWLIDTLRVRMGGNELLDFNPDTNQFTGVMEEWQVRSALAGHKITHWIVEINAAQRFLLQYRHVLRWQSHHNVALMPHTTTLKKSDPGLGVDMVKDWWASGRIRLPARGINDKRASHVLVDEVTRYPNAGYDDQVMSHWFGISNLPRLIPPNPEPVRLSRPGFVADIADYRSRSAV